MKRSIAVFTGNRAEYGLQVPILRALRAHPRLELKLVVSGAHLDPDFGRTIEEIRRDGFAIAAEVVIEMRGDACASTSRAIGSGVLALSDAFARLAPDIALVYADRFEGFAAAIAASQMNLVTAHVEGGDVTEGGALDDSVRHAISKLAHLHFTTNAQASNRLLALGEEDWRVHTVGLPALDLLRAGEHAHAAEVARRLGLDLERPVVLFTQHSVTTEWKDAAAQVAPALAALRRLAREGVQVIATFPNNDSGGRAIAQALEDFAKHAPANVQLVPSLGRWLYHGVLALALDPTRRVACVGNSSSGIKETPALRCPSVNVGSRQAGRLRAENVLDVSYSAEGIAEAVRTALFDPSFRARCQSCENPYGSGEAGPAIARVLAELELDRPRLLRKRMTNRGEAREGWFR